MTSLCCLIFAAVVYPILRAAERWRGYNALFTQRRPGEIKVSLLLFFCTHAALIALCWGAFGKPWIAGASILAWGVGDTMAALIGKRYGRHHIRLPHADPKKTWEGSGAMALSAFLACFAALMIASPHPAPTCLLLSLAAAPLAAYAELISHKGHDTFTVASAVAALLLLLTL